MRIRGILPEAIEAVVVERRGAVVVITAGRGRRLGRGRRGRGWRRGALRLQAIKVCEGEELASTGIFAIRDLQANP